MLAWFWHLEFLAHILAYSCFFITINPASYKCVLFPLPLQEILYNWLKSPLSTNSCRFLSKSTTVTISSTYLMSFLVITKPVRTSSPVRIGSLNYKPTNENRDRDPPCNINYRVSLVNSHYLLCCKVLLHISDLMPNYVKFISFIFFIL